MGLSSCALPRIDEEDPEIGLSAANMEGLAPEEELAEGALPSQARPEFPEEILVAGPAYEGERKSPWDIPADEFVTLVERSVEQAGDESLLADGDYLAYASSLLSEKKMYPDAESTEELASLNEGDEEIEDTSVVSGAGTAGEEGLPMMDSLPVIASEAEDEVEVVGTIESGEEAPEAVMPEPEAPAGAITSAGNFTIGGVIETGEEEETANLPRLPVNAHERFRTVRASSYFTGDESTEGVESRSALGSRLQSGSVRSAAADWSHYPVGTRFRIVGDKTELEYVVDDFTDAVNGPLAVGLYMPKKQDKEAWGARTVVIEVLNWGSFEKSVAIMKSSESRMEEPHVVHMVERIESRFEDQSKASRGLRPQGGLLGRIAARRANR